MAATPPALPALDNSLGALEIGIEITILLFGISTVQTYVYFRSFPRDGLVLKSIVAFAWLLDFAHTILVCHTLYLVTITYYGHPEKLIKPPSSTIIATFVGSLLDRMVQVFFAYRLYKLTKSKIAFFILSLVALIILTLTFVAAAEGFKSKSLDSFVVEWGWMFTVAFILDAVVDTGTALALCAFLARQKNGVLQRTNILVDRLMLYTIQTGLITSFVAITAAVTFQTMKFNSVWIAIYAALPGFFSNAFLAALNSRKALQKINGPTSGQTHATDMDFPVSQDIEFARSHTHELELSGGSESTNRGTDSDATKTIPVNKTKEGTA